MFTILIVALASWAHVYVKTFQTALFKYIAFVVYPYSSTYLENIFEVEFKTWRTNGVELWRYVGGWGGGLGKSTLQAERSMCKVSERAKVWCVWGVQRSPVWEEVRYPKEKWQKMRSRGQQGLIFIYSFSKYLQSAHYMPGAVLGVLDGISLLALSQQSTSDWVAQTTEINFSEF